MLIHRPARWGATVTLLATLLVAGPLTACSGDDNGSGTTTVSTAPSAPTTGDADRTAPPASLVVGRPAAGTTAVLDGEPRDLGGGCRAFPRNHFWHAVVSQLPVHSRSNAFLAALTQTSGKGLRLTASSTPWEGSFGGRPVNVIAPDGRAEERDVSYDEARPGAGTHRRDPARIPLPENFTYEGYPNPLGAWDKHVLVMDTRTCTGWELFFTDLARYRLTGQLHATGGARWDLRSNDGPVDPSGNKNPIGTNVARVPIVGGSVSYDEMATGRIDHAVHVCVTGASKEAVWPASWSDGKGTGPDAPPMGTWLRLRPDYDIGRFGPQVRVVMNGLATHGGIATDSCAERARLSMEPDPRWDAAQWRNLELPWTAFEVVEASGIAVAPGASFEIR